MSSQKLGQLKQAIASVVLRMYNSDSFIVSQSNVDEMESHNHVTYVVSEIRSAYNYLF